MLALLNGIIRAFASLIALPARGGTAMGRGCRTVGQSLLGLLTHTTRSVANGFAAIGNGCRAIGRAMLALLNGIGRAFAGLIALPARAVTALGRGCRTVGQSLLALLTGIVRAFSQGFAAVGRICRARWRGIARGFSNGFAAIGNGCRAIGRAMLALLNGIGRAFAGLIALPARAVTALGRGCRTVGQSLLALLTGIVRAFSQGFAAVGRICRVGWRGIARAFSNGFAAIGNGCRAIGRAMLALLNGIGRAFAGLIALPARAVTALGRGCRTVGQSLLALLTGIVRAFSQGFAAVGRICRVGWRGIARAFSNGFAAIGIGCRAMWRAMLALLNGIVRAFANGFAAIRLGCRGVLRLLLLLLRSTVHALENRFRAISRSGRAAVGRSTLSLINFIPVLSRRLAAIRPTYDAVASRTLPWLLSAIEHVFIRLTPPLSRAFAAIGSGNRTVRISLPPLLTRADVAFLNLKLLLSRGFAAAARNCRMLRRSLTAARIEETLAPSVQLRRVRKALVQNIVYYNDRLHLNSRSFSNGGIMSTNEPAKATAVRRRPSRGLATWLLASAVVFALACNVFQFVRQQQLERDVDVGRQRAERQIKNVNEAVSGVLQQSLIRDDQLNKQLEAVKAAAAERVSSEAKHASAPARRFARRRRDVPELSDLQSDLRQEAAFKAQISSDLQKTDSDLQRVAGELDARNESTSSASKDVEEPTLAAAHQVEPEPAQVATPPKKRRFWRKLNPFHWKKHSSGSDTIQ